MAGPARGRFGEAGFWLAMLALAAVALASLVLPAMRENRRTRDLWVKLRQDTERLRQERDRLRLERDALENDPDAVERALRDQGYTPAGQERVVVEPPRHR